MNEVAARAVLVSAPDVGEGVTTSISRSELEEVLGTEGEPIELVLEIARFSDGETAESGSVSVSWERSDIERLLEEAAGDEVTLTFDRAALQEAAESDVEAHGLRETVLAVAVAATAATGAAATAAAEPGPFLGAGSPIAQSLGPDDRAVSRAIPTPAPSVAPDDRTVSRAAPGQEPSVSPDDRAVPRTAPTPTPQVAPDDRAVPRATPIEAPTPGLAPDDRAVPRTAPTPTPQFAPDDRAVPRATPIEAPTPGLAPDDRAVPRGTPVAPPATGTVSDPGISWAPSPADTAVLAGLLALAITGAFFLVGGRRVRPRPA